MSRCRCLRKICSFKYVWWFRMDVRLLFLMYYTKILTHRERRIDTNILQLIFTWTILFCHLKYYGLAKYKQIILFPIFILSVEFLVWFLGWIRTIITFNVPSNSLNAQIWNNKYVLHNGLTRLFYLSQMV